MNGIRVGLINTKVKNMKSRYMIVRISKIFETFASLTQSCYEVIETDFISPEIAYEKMKDYRKPQSYIIVPYWSL